MKTRFIVLALALAASVSFTACQATPEEQIVVEKDTERLVEQITEDKNTKVSNDLELPDGHYKWEATGADGNLSINVDAKVSAPADKLPTARVKGTGFDQATVTKLFNYLFPEEKPYITTSDMPIRTKDEIQEDILIIKKHISEKSTEEYEMMSEEEALETIKQLENELKSAPDSIPSADAPVESDGTMFPSTFGTYGATGLINEEKTLRLEAKNDTAKIFVETPVSENGGEEAFFEYYKDQETEYNYVVAELNDENKELPEEAQGKLNNLSFEDAKEICSGFLAAGNIKDIQLDRAYLACDGYLNSPEGVIKNDNPEHYCYDLYYTRVVNNTPSANLVDLYGVMYVDAEEGELEGEALPWTYEMMSFRIDDSGLISVIWHSPVDIGEILNPDTDLLTFDEVKEVFETMIMRKYEPKTQANNGNISNTNIRIDINEVRLGLVRIRTQNADGREGIFIPAWIFYGKKESSEKYDSENTLTMYNNCIYDAGADKPLMIINAVDGSIIDPAKGY